MEDDTTVPFDAWLAAHADWAPPVAFALAFLESLPVVSLFVPATALLMAAGLLVAAGTLEAGPVIAAAMIGAILGDAVGFWGARALGARALRRRVPARYRRAYARAVLLLRRWGWAAVFLGRFAGPLRAVVPLAAGVAGMREWVFQSANVASALVWVPVLLLPGTLAGWGADLFADTDLFADAVDPLFALGAVAVAVVLVALARRLGPWAAALLGGVRRAGEARR